MIGIDIIKSHAYLAFCELGQHAYRQRLGSIRDEGILCTNTAQIKHGNKGTVWSATSVM